MEDGPLLGLTANGVAALLLVGVITAAHAR